MNTTKELTTVVEANPGCTAGELRDALRDLGRVSITVADLVTELRAYPRRFRPDGEDPPRWWLAGCPGAPAPAPAGSMSGARLPTLYAWQVEAFDAWHRCGSRGVVEAVTGTGKTLLGIAAIAEELGVGGQACVLVPTTDLLGQWGAALHRHLPPATSVGLLGGGHHDGLGDHDVLVAVVNSARTADLRPRRPGGLLVADECHRYGSDGNRVALEARFVRRLGLSATYERADDGHLAWLDPYFGGTCFRIGYRRAIHDGVTARFKVALVGVRLLPGEQADYDDLSALLSALRARLISRHGLPAEPIGVFLQAVVSLGRAGGDDEGAMVARQYLRAMQDRRQLLADTPAKSEGLAQLVPALVAADRSIVFTQTIVAASRAAALLRAHGLTSDTVHSGLDASERRSVLSRFAAGGLQVVTAPQVLDEGVDVPAADLAVILAASRSRRQMVQRMGRVLRRKPDGRLARFVVLYAEATVEDPARGAHEGFLDEVTEVADAVRSFPPDSSSADLCAFVDPASQSHRS